MTARRLKTTEVAAIRQQLYIRQGGICPLCKTKIPRLPDACLDHDHDSGLIRAVLCRNCNGVEGKIRNLVRRARRGMPYEEYLNRVGLYWKAFGEHNPHRLYHPTHRTADEKREIRNRKARERRKTRARK